MGQKKIKKVSGKVLFKHETELIWDYSNDGAGVNYIPEQGEKVIYDPDEQHPYPRVKYGDGEHIVKDLPFAVDAYAVAFGYEQNLTEEEKEQARTNIGIDEIAGEYAEIIDVISLPTTNISDKATYRLLKGIFMRGGLMRNDYNCYIVEWDSPSGSGEPVIKYINGEMIVSGYYNNKNNTVYGYVDSVTKEALKAKIDEKVADGSLDSIVAAGLKLAISTMSTGWKTMDEIFSNAVVSQLASWGGIINSPEQATNKDAAYVLLYDEFYSYKHNTWIRTSDIDVGMFGEGAGAEKFNDINNVASGSYSHAEGNMASATGHNTHAEGYATLAEGNASHAEGAGSKTYALAAHAEGRDSYANSEASHAEGEFTSATGVGSHTEGYRTRTNGKAAHHEGIRLDGSETVTKNGVEYTCGANTDASHAEGINTVAGGESGHKAAHAEGADSIAAGWSAHAEGLGSYAVGNAAHAEGRGTSASGEGSHAEGRDTVAQGVGAHVEGVRLSQYEPAKRDNKEYKFGAFAQGAHAEGLNTGAHGEASHTEGSDTIVTAKGGHAEGLATYVTGQGAHAEGRNTWATGNYAHSEGYNTKAQGVQSHAAGSDTIAKGASSYAGGTNGSTAYTTGSFVHGKGVKDSRWYQAVFGLYNKHEIKEDGTPVETADYLVVGSGSSDTARENCFTAGKNSTDGKYITIGNTKLTEQALINFIDMIQPFTITGNLFQGQTITLPYTGNEMSNHLSFTIRHQVDEKYCYVFRIYGYYNDSNEVQIQFDASSYVGDGGVAMVLQGYSSSNQFTVLDYMEV